MYLVIFFDINIDTKDSYCMAILPLNEKQKIWKKFKILEGEVVKFFRPTAIQQADLHTTYFLTLLYSINSIYPSVKNMLKLWLNHVPVEKCKLSYSSPTTSCLSCRISLNTMTLQVDSPTVYTSQGVPISVTGIAQVSLSRTITGGLPETGVAVVRAFDYRSKGFWFDPRLDHSD